MQQSNITWAIFNVYLTRLQKQSELDLEIYSLKHH